MPRRKPTLRNRNHRSPKIPSHSQSSEQPSEEDLPEQPIELTVTAVANGGACVARYDGRVVFVRHTLPGERVLARVTGSGSRGRFWFADAVEIMDPAPQRVDAPCQLAGPGGCGGCDYQHVALDEQRRWKSEVVAEQLQRLGGIAVDVPIRALPGSSDGLGWRSRIRYAVNESGQVGFHQYRSDQVVPVDRCLIASPEIQQAEVADELVSARDWSGYPEVVVAEGSEETVVAAVPAKRNGKAGRLPAATLVEHAVGRDWEVAIDGFWQVHSAAADTLCDEVISDCAQADVIWDLYCGVGLFAGALAQQRRRHVTAVEGDRRAAEQARQNLADLTGVQVVRRDVRTWVESPRGKSPDAVVLDPPRRGAGEAVLTQINRTKAQRIVYVACEPASLGRDTGVLRKQGWTMSSVQAFDMFPMTHHVESIAVFDR